MGSDRGRKPRGMPASQPAGWGWRLHQGVAGDGVAHRASRAGGERAMRPWGCIIAMPRSHVALGRAGQQQATVPDTGWGWFDVALRRRCEEATAWLQPGHSPQRGYAGLRAGSPAVSAPPGGPEARRRTRGGRDT